MDPDGTVHIKVVISITTNGTGAGTINFTLPVNSKNADTLSGVENGVSARGVGCVMGVGGSQAITWFSSDGSYPGGDGRVLTISGTYRKD